MAKLYWRYKKNGKWTWKSSRVHSENRLTTIVFNHEEEEE